MHKLLFDVFEAGLCPFYAHYLCFAILKKKPNDVDVFWVSDFFITQMYYLYEW